MIEIDCLDVSRISKDVYEKYYKMASPERRQRADQYRSFEDARRCIFSHALLRFVLSEICGFGCEPVIAYSQYGKPYIENVENFSYNISHSGKWVVLAFSRQKEELGVDVEKIRDSVDCEKIARRFFAAEEKQYLSSAADGSERAERFARIWTLKESYVKYLGTGLTKSLDSFWVDGKTGCVRDFSGRETDGLVLKSFLLEDSYVSVCSRCKDVVIRTVVLNDNGEVV